MYGGLQVCTDIRIDDDCSIRYDVNGSGEADFVVADRNESLGIVIQSEALREFLKVAGEALAEMDARCAREQAEDQVRRTETSRHQVTPVHAVEPGALGFRI